jgi:hypothetical protein
MQRRALVVGLDHYEGGAALAGCINDAHAVAEALSKHDDGSLNYTVRTITSDVGTGVTRHDLRSALTELFRAAADDRLLFYFSGHGRATDVGAELVTTDLDGVAMSEIITRCEGSKACEVVVILDCCFSGDAGNLPVARLMREVSQVPEGVVILAGARPDEPAVETGGQGVFTRLLVEGLRGAAADHLGVVSPLSLHDFIARGFDAWEQHPVLKAHLVSTCELRRTSPPLDRELLRSLPSIFPSAEDRVVLSPEHEGERTPGVPLTPAQEQFERFKRLRNAGLLVSEGDRDLYWAAMQSESVSLSPLGRYFWRLAHDGKL